jgi:hypothetical protein
MIVGAIGTHYKPRDQRTLHLGIKPQTDGSFASRGRSIKLIKLHNQRAGGQVNLAEFQHRNLLRCETTIYQSADGFITSLLERSI